MAPCSERKCEQTADSFYLWLRVWDADFNASSCSHVALVRCYICAVRACFSFCNKDKTALSRFLSTGIHSGLSPPKQTLLIHHIHRALSLIEDLEFWGQNTEGFNVTQTGFEAGLAEICSVSSFRYVNGILYVPTGSERVSLKARKRI